MAAQRTDGLGLRLELKYCERCGELWLRGAGGESVFCSRCGAQLDEEAALLAGHGRRVA